MMPLALSVPALDVKRLLLTSMKNVARRRRDKKKNWFGNIFLPLCLGRTHPLPVRTHTSPLYSFFLSLHQGMKKGLRTEVKKMGPLKVAHLNGLSVSRPPLHSDLKDEPERASNDERVSLHFPTRQTSEMLTRRSISASRPLGLVLRVAPRARERERERKKDGRLSVASVCW